jgi:hypothetical protein
MFGSQTRPGMRGNLGSLGGSTLGDAPVPDTSEPTTKTPPVVPAVTAPVYPPKMSTNKKVAIGVGLVAAYWMFFRKKG